MFSKLFVGILLLICNANLLVKCFPHVQGRSGTHATHPLREYQPQQAEDNVEDSDSNKMVAFVTLPLSTEETSAENKENIPITNSYELNQTSIMYVQEILDPLQHRSKFKENTNDFQSDLLTSTEKSGDDKKVFRNESLINVETVTPVHVMLQDHIFSNNTSSAEDHTNNANQMPLNGDFDTSSKQTIVGEAFVTTPQSGLDNSFMNGHYPDYEDLQSDNVNEHDMEGIMNDDENDDFLQNEDENALPSALKNLPHDIPPDRTIYEVLAENIVKDKQYDEFRIEELIHELMDHYDTHNGLDEVYAGETDYDEKARTESKGNTPILAQIMEASTTASPYK